MKNRLLALAFLVLALVPAQAQFGSFGDVPVEIDSKENRFEAGIAIAEDNVVIRYGDTTIYCDYAQYNPETRDVLVRGNVRLYRGGQLFTGERALYNFETKVFNAADFRGDFTPFRFAGDSVSTIGNNAYLVKEGIFTTSDNSKPDYYLRAKSVRIYPNDRIIFTNVKLYVGKTQVFWFPYIYQSLNKEQGFTIVPGYSSSLGSFLFTQYTFPIGENWSGKVRLDLMSERGLGVGFESEWGNTTTAAITGPATKGKETKNWGRFRSYYVDDASPETDRSRGVGESTSSTGEMDSQRYRISLQNRTYLTEDIYASIDINKLSDRRFLQDFAEGEFRQNPNPDNAISLTKWDEDYTVTLLGRVNLNEEDFDATERLPELALDIKRQPLLSSRFFYEGETSAGFLRRNFASTDKNGNQITDPLFEDYDSIRADTFHQITYPGTYFGWLSVIPRVGVRGTYYSDSGSYEDFEEITTTESTETFGDLLSVTTRETTTRRGQRLERGGSLFRPAVNAGVEASFKFSRAFEQVQSRMWGLDGLRHVVQPFVNASFVYSGEDPKGILQFDRLNRSTQLPPIDFPQFNTIDSIDNWSIVRLGVRNRLQTRRDNTTLNWLELNTYFDVNLERPDFGGGIAPDDGTFSNIFNRLRWVPLPWVSLNIDSQLPLLDSGFTEVATTLNFLVNSNVQLNLGHRYIEGHTEIGDGNVVNLGGYVRFNENWGFSFRESYEFEEGALQSQRYEVHRDLSSWVASLGLLLRDVGETEELGLLLTFTLKDLPNIRLPLPLDPEGIGGGTSGSGGSSRNR
ncbi:MAG TPA: LPS assembly protein LptD [Chthoniobacteraceae bacterium]|jgi:hypothetical protein